MDARLFLSIARTLAKTPTTNPDEPAAYRSSISRSYYALFNASVVFLESIGLEVIDKPRGHSWVKNSFVYTADLTIKAIGMGLETLHKERKYADYEMSNPRAENQKPRGCGGQAIRQDDRGP
jgi:hypothetical protein